MQRRAFIAALGGVVAALMSARSAQAQQKLHRVGALILGNADAQSFRTEVLGELRKSGYAEGRNLTFDLRSAEGKLDRLSGLAVELVALKPDVIMALYTPCAFAVQRATRDIPIVAVAANLVETGFVPSLARPDGNLTGLSLMAAEAHGKCVELLRDMLPTVRRVAALGNAADPFSKLFLEQVEFAGKITGIEIAPVVMVHGLGEIDTAFATMQQAAAGAVVIQGSLSTKGVADLALKHRLASATFTRAFAEVGGLMSYGADNPDSFRRGALFVRKLLQGSKVADLPIEQPTKFELVINLKTAKTLGLQIAESFLLRADTIIE